MAETGYSTQPGADQGFSGSVEDLGERSSYTSPGWKRLKENAARGVSEAPRTLEGEATLLATSGGTSGFEIGQRVFHDKFGYGHVQAVEGNKLSVAFQTGVKKVISTFVVAA